MSKKPKVVLFGIDAADPDYVDSRIAQGALPNLARLRNEGAWGKMKSTFPVLSSAAWSSIATGLPPEKHGIYEFFRRQPGTWQDIPIHGGLKKGEDFWSIAAREGYKSVVINMPITYPPRNVPNSVVVSGMDTPGESTEFVSPREEKPPLIAKIPDYRIELTAAQYDKIEDFLSAVSKTMKARYEAACYLFDRHQPDLAVVIFTSLDRVLHALWKYIDPRHPASKRPEAKKWREKVDQLYDQVDQYLGEMIKWAGEEATVFVCSDHGGAATHGVFYLNRWLYQQGYLRLKKGSGPNWLKIIAALQNWVKRNVPRSIKNIFNRLLPQAYVNVETLKALSQLDPQKTKAYAWRKTDVVRINLAGREPGGIVTPGKEYESLQDEIKSKLEKLVDPRTNRVPIKQILKKQEAYPLAGTLEDCPDLVIDWGDFLYNCDTTFKDLNGPVFMDEELKSGESWRNEINGNHALYGVFGGLGPEISPGMDLRISDILSITPSILNALGIKPLADMPGLIPDGMFKNYRSDDNNLKSKAQASHSQPSNENVYSEEEQALIEKRLKDLGYM